MITVSAYVVNRLNIIHSFAVTQIYFSVCEQMFMHVIQEGHIYFVLNVVVSLNFLISSLDAMSSLIY